MTGEQAAFGATETQQEQVLPFDEYNSLPDAYMMSTYGMTSEEGRQGIQFREWNGTIAQMLSDPRCPVGEMIKNAHQDNGTEGVQQAFLGLRMMAPDVKIEVSPKDGTTYALFGATEPKKKVI